VLRLLLAWRPLRTLPLLLTVGALALALTIIARRSATASVTAQAPIVRGLHHTEHAVRPLFVDVPEAPIHALAGLSR
jgi:hypothetical protein